jgi:hypothetical protein
MKLTLGSRLINAWNVFKNNRDPTDDYNYEYYSSGSTYRPDRPRLTRGNAKSISASVFNRIALDVAAIDVKHCRLDKEDRFIEIMNSNLNECLTLSANIDQTHRAFLQDAVLTMFDKGVIAIVPVDTTTNPNMTNSYDILSMRVGEVLEWFPNKVKARLYNDRTGKKEDLLLSKEDVAIIENPFYTVVNDSNSTLQRLKRKLSLLDVTDEKTASSKLDLIIQLPYIIKSNTRKKQAEERSKQIEDQLAGSKYGIAYIDGTEKITQLNRSVENNLMSSVEYLTNQFFAQMNITQSILDGTADEKTMLNYNNRTIEPIISAIVNELKRKFLTKTARTQGQSICFFRDPFRLVPVNDMAEIADKFTRNEIMTSNEIRQAIGMKPSNDPKADELVNSNISQPTEEQNYPPEYDDGYEYDEGGENQNEV